MANQSDPDDSHSRRRTARQRRRARRRAQFRRMEATPRFLLLLMTDAVFRPVEQVDQVEDEDLPLEEAAIDHEDMRAMRANIEAMQLQIRDGLRNIQELRDLLTQVAASHQHERSVGQSRPQQVANAFVSGTTWNNRNIVPPRASDTE